MSAVTLPVDHGRPGVMARSGNSEDSRFVRFFGWSSAETSAIHCQVLTLQVTGYLRGPRLPCDRRARVVVSPHGRSRRRKVIITTLAVITRYFLEVTSSSCPGPARQVIAPPAGRLRMPPGTVRGAGTTRSVMDTAVTPARQATLVTNFERECAGPSSPANWPAAKPRGRDIHNARAGPARRPRAGGTVNHCRWFINSLSITAAAADPAGVNGANCFAWRFAAVRSRPAGGDCGQARGRPAGGARRPCAAAVRGGPSRPTSSAQPGFPACDG
jgi:hypothetical protein